MRPFTLQERLQHVQKARETLGSKFDWICDAMENPIKHALGNAPNSEFVIDPEGRIARRRSWSSPEDLRKDLEDLVGLVENPTDPRDVQLKVREPVAAAARGVVPRIELPGNLRAVVIEPVLEKEGEPFYAKLRAEADGDLLRDGKGQLYLRFMMDPLYHVHWNNLVEPIRVRFLDGKGAKAAMDDRVQPAEWTGPKVKEAADIDPREFLATVDSTESQQSLHLEVKYFACHDEEGWCKPVTQRYVVHLRPDADGGRVTQGRARDRIAGRRPGFEGRPGFDRRPGFGGRRGFDRRPGGFGGRPGFDRRPGFRPFPSEDRRPVDRGPATAAFGLIGKIDGKAGTVVVEIRGGGRQEFLVLPKTRVQYNRRVGTLVDCHVGDRVVVRFDPGTKEPRTASSLLVRGK